MKIAFGNDAKRADGRQRAVSATSIIVDAVTLAGRRRSRPRGQVEVLREDVGWSGRRIRGVSAARLPRSPVVRILTIPVATSQRGSYLSNRMLLTPSEQ